METKDHLLLAKTLAEELQLSYDRKMAFIIGNLAPDINPLSYLSPFRKRKLNGHSYEHRKGSIERFLEKRGCRTCFDWYRIGKTAHYLADSFTRPHNERFSFRYWEHLVYEHRLHRVFYEQTVKNLRQCKKQTAAVDVQWYRRCHARYVLESRGCIDDCAYILQVVWAFCAKFKRVK